MNKFKVSFRDPSKSNMFAGHQIECPMPITVTASDFHTKSLGEVVFHNNQGYISHYFTDVVSVEMEEPTQ